MRICVVIASLGRPEELADIAKSLEGQSLAPHRVVFAVVQESDLPDRSALSPGAEIIFGPKGGCVQRNRGIDRLMGDSDVIVFFDDDYIPSKRALEGVKLFFENNPDYVGATGHLLADGINSAGISKADALAMIDEYDRESAKADYAPVRDLTGLYGCNMAFRTSAIGDTRFDENLPLYGWQEDIDFAASLLPKGRLAKTDAFAGVHRGVKGGRTSGLKLGYSQVANPFYLMRKGTMQRSYAVKLIAKNMAANFLKTFRPEPWVDRKGRMRGNWLAIRDVFSGRSHPGKILTLEDV